ncbi:MAG: hypothetical protein IPF58_09075 [Saprospirales bacterium]|nr:hypothetical protein [Saprospirales bacterium]
MKKLNLFILSIAIISFIASCKKESTPEGPGMVAMEFDNRAGSSDLKLNTIWYKNANNDSMNFSLFKYYVSNFIFTKEDGSTYVVPKETCYFLIDEADDISQTVEFPDVPAGKYTSVTFTIGVDSLKSTAPQSERTGVLDVTTHADMYWVWNSGYIFVKTEGKFSQAAGADFMYHVGGFGGYSSPTQNNLKTVTLTFPGAPVSFGSNNHKHIHTFVDALKVVNGSTNISVPTTPVLMGGPNAPAIANNYKNMFVVDHIEAE